MALSPSSLPSCSPPYEDCDTFQFIQNTLALDSRECEPELWAEDNTLELPLQEVTVHREVASSDKASDVDGSAKMSVVRLPFSG